ncbi:MAG: universal stress protein [Armatimonadota bacterium]|jgi:two-component system sensor histidine kinase KdpD
MTQEERLRSESRATKQRGRLKIFLGAVAGVGKTYRMLSEAHRRVERNGEDVVIGLVETHGRPATAALVAGIEQVPMKAIEYRGKTLYELDTDAVVARHPEWVLVDELAHTNIPGARHPKRWQSVEEIRDAGIGVISTLNIQHLESLNDAVYEITGVRVRETIPDAIVDTADEVELEDLTPDALINRLKRGDIYQGEKIPQALTNFFRKGNIVALRELALRKAVDEVDTELHGYMDAHHMRQGKAAHEHITVLIAPRRTATRLVRRGYRLAKRMQGTFSALHVRVPGDSLGKEERAFLDEAYDLTRNLGGQVVELYGDSVPQAIITHANEAGTTFIVMGQSARSRLSEIIRGSIINRIMRDTKNIDIVVVADSRKEEPVTPD